jgi:hypothetical protein
MFPLAPPELLPVAAGEKGWKKIMGRLVNVKNK